MAMELCCRSQALYAASRAPLMLYSSAWHGYTQPLDAPLRGTGMSGMHRCPTMRCSVGGPAMCFLRMGTAMRSQVTHPQVAKNLSSPDHAKSVTWLLCPLRLTDSFQFSTLGPSKFPKAVCPGPPFSSYRQASLSSDPVARSFPALHIEKTDTRHPQRAFRASSA